MNQPHKSLHEELDSLQNDFSELFSMVDKPKLSKKQKNIMLKQITGKKWQLPKLAVISFATTFAVIMIIFGVAQISTPDDILYDLKIGNKTQKTQPITVQEVEEAIKAVELKQTEVQQLLKQNAEPKVIKKAESELTKAQEIKKETIKKYQESQKLNNTELQKSEDQEDYKKEFSKESTEQKSEDD